MSSFCDPELFEQTDIASVKRKKRGFAMAEHESPAKPNEKKSKKKTSEFEKAGTLESEDQFNI